MPHHACSTANALHYEAVLQTALWLKFDKPACNWHLHAGHECPPVSVLLPMDGSLCLSTLYIDHDCMANEVHPLHFLHTDCRAAPL